MVEGDFLDKIVTKRTARNPAFPQMLDVARRRRALLRRLEERSEQQNQMQTAVAAAMATSRSFVARLESTAADARVSIVQRYGGSLGCVLQYHLVPLDQSAAEPTVVVHESSSVSNGV